MFRVSATARKVFRCRIVTKYTTPFLYSIGFSNPFYLILLFYLIAYKC